VVAANGHGYARSVYGPVRTTDAPFDVVVIAGSLGAIGLYRTILAEVPAGLAAAIVVVQHRRPHHDDRLAEVLGRVAALPVTRLPGDGPIAPGAIYVAPAGCQARFVAPWTIASEPIPDDRFPRPRADPLMASAAGHHGARTMGVVLSGRLDDGARGARAVKLAGGQVLAQHPETAEAEDMPSATLATGCVDLCLSPQQIGHAIAVLCGVPGAAPLFRGRLATWALTAGP
jgi:chemotaxis response regulator CheB